MGDKATLAKAKKELEDLYLGIPDDSVNLTFQDLAEVRQQHAEKKKSPPMDPILEPGSKTEISSASPMAKIPSLDFSKGLQASMQNIDANNQHHHNYEFNHPFHNHHHHVSDNSSDLSNNHRQLHQGHFHGSRESHHGHHHPNAHGHHMKDHANAHGQHMNHHADFGHGIERSMVYGDISLVSGMSMASMSQYHERGGRRRPGIPHSNICTICSNYIYIFRHRCLVCGRVYCRQCVSIGMGDMTEGRKCIECLGRKFSQRYIQQAGNVGCCMGYPSKVKQQELKWAEKGPRTSVENRYGHSSMVSTSRPRTPTRTAHSTSNPPSFVMSSPYSPYSPTTHHALPF